MSAISEPRLRYRAVLFDLDGTLVDSYAALAEAVNFARREHGLHELSAARIRDFVGDGLDTTRSAARSRRSWPTSRRRWKRCTAWAFRWPSARTSRRRSRKKS